MFFLRISTRLSTKTLILESEILNLSAFLHKFFLGQDRYAELFGLIKF